jgi:NAD(P)H-dependent flavin oxidoreductase YrpB (nitropropane dioxygenase family)
MLLFGHPFIHNSEFFHIFDITAIEKTPPGAYIYLEYSKENLDIIQHLQQNNITFALSVQTVTEAIYAAALNADFIVVHKKIATMIQDIAESYLFDAKVLAHITKESEIEAMARHGIDGVIFPEAIVKINS